MGLMWLWHKVVGQEGAVVGFAGGVLLERQQCELQVRKGAAGAAGRYRWCISEREQWQELR